MDRAELLQIIRESFDIYQNNNSHVPTPRGLTEMLDAMVQLLDGHTGATGADIEELKQQLADLRAVVEGITPGLSEAEVDAKIATAVGQIQTTLDALQQKDNEQDTRLDGMQQALDDLPGPAEFTDLSAKVADVLTRLTANEAKDAQQDTDIEGLQQALDEKATVAALTDLEQALQNLQTELIANQQTDDQQTADIAQLRADLDGIPSGEDLSELKTAIEAVETDLAANTTHDQEQDQELSTLKEKVEQLPTAEDLEQVKTKCEDLETSLEANIAHDAEQDQAISEIREELQNVPTDTALGQIREDITQLQSDLTANTTHDGEQDTAISGLQDQLQNIPNEADFSSLQAEVETLKGDLAANTTHDGEQDQRLDDIEGRVELLPNLGLIEDLKTALEALEAAVEANKTLDEEQEAKITKLQEDLLLIPTDAAIQAIRDSIAQLEASLSANITRDDQQDERLTQIEEDLEKIPTDAALRRLREAIEALQAEADNNRAKDEQQDSDILELRWELQNNYATQEAIDELSSSLSALENSFANNVTRDDQQDAAIEDLRQRIEGVPTDANLEKLRQDLDANELRDDEQDAAIGQIRTDLENIPTEAGLQELRDAIADLLTKWTSNQQRDDSQDDRLTSLEGWRTNIIAAIAALREEIGGSGDVEALKAELLAKIAEVREECEQKIAALDGLPDRVAALEQRLDEFVQGISAADARTIALEEIALLREELEQRLQLIETKIGDGIGDLPGRLDQAESDIRQLFELVGEGGGGTGQDGASKAYVQAQLRSLADTLRAEIMAIDTKYNGLLGLPGVVQALQLEMANKTSLEQVNALIASATSTLATKTELEQLRVALEAAFETYVQEQCAACLAKITEAENRLREEWTTQLEEAIANLWEQLPEQEFPVAWQEQVRTIAAELDAILKTEILAQLETWNQEIRTLIEEGDQNLENNILVQISETYVSNTDLAAEKEAILAQVQQQIADALAELPPILSEEQVTAIAAAEAERLDQVLSDRIAALEQLDLVTQLQQLNEFQTTIENLDLSTFITHITNLDLSSIISLVNTINVWKQRVEGEFADLSQRMEELEERVGDYTDEGVGDRLSRICLTGWGPVSGMEIYSDQEHCVHLSAGQCISPDGYLITLEEERTFASYYALPEGHDMREDYPFFAEIPVWRLVRSTPTEDELAEVEAAQAQVRWLTPQTNRERDEPFIADKMIVVLPGPNFYLLRIQDYLELADKMNTVRRLVEAEREFEDADYKFSSSFSSADDLPTDSILYRAFNPAYNLGTIPLCRFGFCPDDDCTVEELDQTDFPASLTTLAEFYETWKPNVNSALTTVNERVGYMLEQYHAVLFPQLPKDQWTETLEILLANWTTYTRNAERSGGRIERCYVQYFYDWARDLIRAYHECRICLQDLMAEFCLLTPDSLSDRNGHVALGTAWQPQQDGLAAPLRDSFHQPPVYNDNARRLERTRVYFRRIFELIESFYLPEALPNDLLPPKFRQDEDDPFEPDFSRIKITPGRNLGSLLSQQAIPFYYPLTEGDGSLQYYWEYRKAKNRTFNQHRSYHASDGYESYNHPDDWHVTRPLYYSIDEVDFYRVEGHLNRPLIDPETIGAASELTTKDMDAVDAIRYLMQKHNLDCRVVSIQLPNNLAANLTQEANTFSFIEPMLGAEHLGGVPKGGTLIVVLKEVDVEVPDPTDPTKVIVEQMPVAVGDFAVPYHLSQVEIDNYFPTP